MIVDFRRLPYGALSQQINFTSHVQRDPVRRQRIGRRRVWYGQGDIDFYYAWHEQGFTYLVSSKYYGNVRPRQLAVLVADAHELRSRTVSVAYYENPTASFTGDTCGATSTNSWTLPAGAFAARTGSPPVRTVFDDTTTDAPVARVTTAQVVPQGQRLVAEWVATGSDDVCSNPDNYPSGWETFDAQFFIYFSLHQTEWY